MSSLRRRVFLWAALPTAVILAGFSAYDYVTASRPATLAYDQALLSTALDIRPYVGGDAERPHLELPPAVEDALRTDVSDRLWFSVRRLDGTFVAGDPKLPSGFEAHDTPAFVDTNYRGEPVRLAVVRLPTAAGPMAFVVGETRHKRNAMTRGLVRSLVLVNLLLIGSVSIAVVLGVRRGLRPLADLRAQLMARSHLDLRPLRAADAPSELRPIVDEINSLFDRLDTALAVQNRFVANAAHQLRTPLAGLKMQLELALDQQMPPAAADLIRRGRAATDQLARMANQLLALARAEPGAQAGHTTQIDLATEVGELVDSAVHAALAGKVDLGFELASAPVLGNSTLLREMATNLIDNAIRYAGRDAHVTVRTFEEAGQAVFEVEDDGPGIPPAERERVLERFYRLETAQGPGSGLGLAIVKEIAALHGAVLSLRCAKHGRGLNAGIRFPALGGPRKMARPAGIEPATPGFGGQYSIR